MRAYILAVGFLCAGVCARSAELPPDSTKYTIDNCVNVFTAFATQATRS